MLTIEAEITPGMSVAEVVELARLVEEVGFDRLGISDVPLYHDCFQLLSLCASATRRVQLGPLVTNPYSHHPVLLASAASTLAEVSQGRAFLGLGWGAGLEEIGIAQPRPVTALRESIGIINDLLAGKTVNHEGSVFHVAGARMVRAPRVRVPIGIGTRSPQTMRLAGELADIAIVGARYMTPEMAASYRQWVAQGAARAGRSPRDVEIAPRLTLCVSRDGAAAKQSVKLHAAYYLTLLKPPEIAIEPERRARIEAAVRRASGWYFAPDVSYPVQLHDLIGDDIVERFAIAGTPAECLEQMRQFARMGFTSASMNLAAVRRGSMYDGLRETITGFGEVIDQVKRL
ncbi:MAG TPA: LLM class flavin-dependent oxidoreductase [Candidatus Binataceae bacterium]|nr:LLM class flavin-dependent oxidoreductase [Candidatus Binataceae bacterium]